MKITCLIDNLSSGGAQRQMCMLAPLLKQHGYDVEVLCYFDHDFFSYLLTEAQVPFRVIPWTNKVQRIAAVYKTLRSSKPDVVIAYLETPSLMAELATIPSHPFKLIVSERNTVLSPGFRNKLFYNFHRLADVVVPNSYSQQKILEKHAPYLKGKIHPIINCVDLNKYKPAKKHLENDSLNILIVGSFKNQKNPLGLCEAVRIIKEQGIPVPFEIDWYGNNLFINGVSSRKSKLYFDVLDNVKKNGLENLLKIHEPVRDIVPLYQAADVLCLPSFYEGCPNVVAEAMACGRPILAGNVCDNPMLVKEGENGFLFDPKDPEEIASTILRFVQLPSEAREQMGTRSRQIVEKVFSPQAFVENYIQLIKKLAP
jgi:glycosyltransferase involved in cell wall biosynthesis